jgi:uncharacterized protein (TIGR02391 family)
MVKRPPQPARLEPREFRSSEEIDAAILKLRRRIEELENLDIRTAVTNRNGTDVVAQNNVRDTIREVFGENSPEFREHEHIRIWAGPQHMGMRSNQIIVGKTYGRVLVTGILNGLIQRLGEKRLDFAAGAAPAPARYFDCLNLHPRIRDVARELFLDGHPWEAVFAAAKALVNYVKERSNRHDLDGLLLVRVVFSKNDPILAFNDLADQTDADEQEGMMHLFEGAVLAIRNPGGHDFPEGPEQRANEYISFLSLLAYRLQQAKVRKRV